MLAARHLTNLGHRKLGLAISDEQHVVGALKERAFVDFIDDTDGVTGSVDHSLYSMEGGMASATRLIATGVTGIICGSDVMALGAIKAARRLGLGVPDDVSVVGYDDSPFMALVEPAVTTIRQPVEAIARAAVGLLTS